MNGRDLTLGLVGALAVGAALGRRGSRAVEDVLYHGGKTAVREPRPGTFLTPDPETAATYARYGPNQERRTPEAGVVSHYAVEPNASIQSFHSFAQAYAHYGVRSTQALARAAARRAEADLVSVYDERVLVRPSSVRWIASTHIEPRGSRSMATAMGWTQEPGKRGSRATDLTSTPAFRRWFGESKVVDEAGSPLVVYHAAPAWVDDFDTFDFGKLVDIGAHFGSERAASEFGTPRALYLSIKNPLRMEDPGDWISSPLNKSDFPVLDEMAGKGIISEPEYETAWGALDELRQRARLSGANREGIPGFKEYRAAASKVLRDLIESKGYDGVVYVNRSEDAGSTSYIAFHPEQIKSATANVGTFDPNDPRISFNRGNR